MPASEKRSLTFFIYFVLTLSTLLVFWQVRHFSFINYDDTDYVTENPHVLSGLTSDSAVWAFTTNRSGNWHPLTWLSLMLDCLLFGAEPGAIHFVNVFFHLANTLLLFAIMKRMTGSLWSSAFVAAAFSLHPMHVESVAWVAERKDVLSTLFWMLTLFAYSAYAKHRSVFRYVLTFTLFALGLMAKPMLVTLPFVILLLDYWPLERFTLQTAGQLLKSAADKQQSRARVVIEKIPFFALAAASSVVTFLVQRRGGAVIDTGALPLTDRVANIFLSYARYITKLVWPQNLAVFYPFDAGSFTHWQIALCVLLLLGISILVICFARRHKYLPVGWFWFVGTLVPVIGVVQVGLQGMADRYSYIPAIGLFIMAAWGIPELVSTWPYRKIILCTSMLIVLTALGICAHQQTAYWTNSSTLFAHAIKVTQNNYLAYNCLADDLLARGNTSDAIKNYQKALQMNPDYANAALGLGGAMIRQGNTAKAVEYFQKAVQLRGGSAYAHDDLGFALLKAGKVDEAVAHFTKAIEIRPDFAQAHNDLATALLQQSRFDEAASEFRAAIKFKSDWADPMNNLALLIATCQGLKNRDYNEGIRLASRACELTQYHNPAFLNTLVAAFAAAGKFDEAVDAAQTALKLDPNSASIHRNLGEALLLQQKFPEAIAHIKRSLEIEPNNPGAKNNQAWIYATSPDPNFRNAPDAIRLAQQACAARDYGDPGMLDTLGAAYASAGKFAEAIEMAKKAVTIAADANQHQLADIINLHLSFYTQGKPYIETAAKQTAEPNRP